MSEQGDGADFDDLVRAAVAEEREALAAALAAETDRWSQIDMNDPVAVARALAEVGMRAGAKVAVVEHMHARVGRAVSAFEAATERLATREDVDRRIRAVEANQSQIRDRDRRQSHRRFVGLVLVGLIFAAIVVSAIVLNRLDIERGQRDSAETARRTDAVAICASTYPGDAPRIRVCVADTLRALDVPSRP